MVAGKSSTKVTLGFVGGGVGFLLSATDEYDDEEDDIKEYLKSTDFGLNLGLGYKLDSGLFFSARYNLDKLIYFENYETKEAALLRERRMKKWNRDWKVELIEKENPSWGDLVDKINKKIDILGNKEDKSSFAFYPSNLKQSLQTIFRMNPKAIQDWP